MNIKISDWVARFLRNRGIEHVFAVTGGASIHLIHSCHNNGIKVICPHHEQAGAFAGDCYARIRGLGCAISTSGPGATNLLTGIAGCYFDSISCLFITGNVVRDRMGRNIGVRNYGFQECDIVSMARSITKYCVQIKKATDIRIEFEKALFIAKNGRPGPVLIDIPDDLQREEIDPDYLVGYQFDDTEYISAIPTSRQISDCYDLLKAAKRPVIIGGFGIKLAKAEKEFLELTKTLDIPVLPTWGINDIVLDKAGTIGVNGTRAGNFAVQNSDFVLAIGTRLSTREVGNSLKTFARAAKMVVVDIDASELAKFPHFGKNLHMAIRSDAKVFIKDLTAKIKEVSPYSCPKKWKDKIAEWKSKYDQRDVVQSHDPIDPYFFVGRLSHYMKENNILVADTGCGLPWLHQGFKFKQGQRMHHDYNNTAMGYGVPAAIGAALAEPHKSIICVVGDGSFMMNLQELATIQHHKLPIKIFVLNNSGYSMVRQTNMEWFEGKHIATGTESLTFPDYYWLSQAFKFQYRWAEQNYQLDEVIRLTINNTQPSICNVVIPEDALVWPKLKYGRPIEDAEPLLPRDEFRDNMIVNPIEGWDKDA